MSNSWQFGAKSNPQQKVRLTLSCDILSHQKHIERSCPVERLEFFYSFRNETVFIYSNQFPFVSKISPTTHNYTRCHQNNGEHKDNSNFFHLFSNSFNDVGIPRTQSQQRTQEIPWRSMLTSLPLRWLAQAYSPFPCGLLHVIELSACWSMHLSHAWVHGHFVRLPGLWTPYAACTQGLIVATSHVMLLTVFFH